MLHLLHRDTSVVSLSNTQRRRHTQTQSSWTTSALSLSLCALPPDSTPTSPMRFWDLSGWSCLHNEVQQVTHTLPWVDWPAVHFSRPFSSSQEGRNCFSEESATFARFFFSTRHFLCPKRDALWILQVASTRCSPSVCLCVSSTVKRIVNFHWGYGP